MENIHEVEYCDTLIWLPELNREFSIVSTYNEVRMKGYVKWWQGYIWNSYIHPWSTGTTWKLVNKITTTDDSMMRRCFKIASKCTL